MKKMFVAAIAIAALAASPAIVAQNILDGSNPGLAMSGSANYNNLPIEAQELIQKHFPGTSATNCEKNFYSGITEVDLSNGTDIEFDSKGRAVEIDAGTNQSLPVAVVKDMLPSKAYKELARRNKANMVESIDRNASKGYKVELRPVDEPDFHFSPMSELVMIVIDD